ncbi:MAG: L,D-transpeptidase catalytic domain [uncultured Thiotrichaceae bacterium]|uniref:L,D-transpeptidase catalytic domain n=1 Tax=uncultured Thiotrichaceae bacterium TaxID=298394 RepID=A0A6S6S5A8_9GAMM|nr:MAG: L,D-transpeptidase catalytic domain [uncultured Thiotrichaceae bacterium]
MMEVVSKKLQAYCSEMHGQYLSLVTMPVIMVSIAKQRLYLLDNASIVDEFVISTASNGSGCQSGSEKTPLGVHRIAQKIGGGSSIYTRFVGRKSTGEYLPSLAHGEYSEVDAITSRIIWLEGLEKGLNKGGNVDSFERYIYIHGTNEEWRLGAPASHGCIRMLNRDVISLFDIVAVHSLVVIVEG